MERSQLEALFVYCQREDPDSARLLDSYLQQRFPGETDFGSSAPPPNNGSGMSRKEALAVLGVHEDASEEDIVAAHRKLMQKMHPDRGGNDYLAAKINQAKDVLLG
jgi:DnaJ-domain-containing protein 1